MTLALLWYYCQPSTCTNRMKGVVNPVCNSTPHAVHGDVM